MIRALGKKCSRVLEMRSTRKVVIFNGMLVGLEGKSARRFLGKVFLGEKKDIWQDSVPFLPLDITKRM